MNKMITFVMMVLWNFQIYSQQAQVYVMYENEGMKLVVDGVPFMVNGMNWDYYPVGTNYTYNLWDQPDEMIKQALDSEMSLLKEIGVNAIRQYTGVPARWITYIYENYGIYTMLNHSFGRYGLTIDGEWMANTEYADPRVRMMLLSEVKSLAKEYKSTPGLLLYLLGNENNFGLFWAGAETEEVPVENRQSTIRARHMYALFNEAALLMKEIDSAHPIAMCNGDLLFSEIIAEECMNVDIFGVNMYRGVSFGDAFERVLSEFNKPILFTEFGADAFNAAKNEEDQESQAYYILGNWKEIYENAVGMGKAGNALGGFTFQFSDGWWKFGQTINLEVHDTNASWSNGGYPRDLAAEGVNNMNEEWFGICAKDFPDKVGLYELTPRAAFYALQEIHKFNPYAEGQDAESINTHFETISLDEAVKKAHPE